VYVQDRVNSPGLSIAEFDGQTLIDVSISLVLQIVLHSEKKLRRHSSCYYSFRLRITFLVNEA
jgi:hypothetical protein